MAQQPQQEVIGSSVAGSNKKCKVIGKNGMVKVMARSAPVYLVAVYNKSKTTDSATIASITDKFTRHSRIAIKAIKNHIR